MLITWGYMRLYIFPLYIISVCPDGLTLVSADSGLYALIVYMICMLCVLQLLHVWWYGLFIGMGYHYIATGTATDMQARTDELGSTDEIVGSMSAKSKAVANGGGKKTK